DGDGTTIRVKSNTAAASDDVTGQIVVGNLGYGALEVRNEATVSARNIELGRSLASSEGVQAAGNGTLSVAGGGVVTITTNSATAYLGLQIADAVGSIGTATVTGVGSELVSTGGAARIRIGDAGTGTLNIQDGGRVAGLFIEAGGATTGAAAILVSGAGATLDLSDEEGRFSANAGQAGLLRLGGESGGAGSLRIENGGAVTISNDPTGTADLPSLIVGSQIGSTGYVDVSGAGSVLEITLTGSATDGFAPNTDSYFGPRLRLGEKGGAGQVTVRDGGAITLTGENAELRVGEAAAGFTSDLSSFTVMGGGSVLLDSTGTESAALVVIGRDDGSRGELIVSGAESNLTVRSDNVDDVLENGGIAFGATITVGQLGDGALRVDDGGHVIIDGTNDAFPGLVVGEGTPAGAIEAVGSVDVSGSGSLLEITGTHPGGPGGDSFGEGGLIAVGLHAGSSGEVTVSAGAAVRNSVANSVMLVASTVQSSGTVRVQGDGSLLFAGALLSVAAAVDLTTVTAEGLPEIDTAAGGAGLVEIGEGARVEAGLTVIGGSGVLDGDGILASDLDLSGELVIAGIGGTGSFEVTGDARLSAGAQISVDISAFDPDQADRLIIGGDLIGALTFDDLNIVLDAAALAAPVATLKLIEVGGEVQATDLEIVTDLNAVLRLRSESGTGLLLDFLGLRVTGTDDADAITGSSIGDTVFGSIGGDTIEGLAGDDLVDFSASPDAVLINLNRGTASGGLAEGDILISIEEIIGSGASDRITGSDGGNRLTGGDGDDELIGRPGSDTLDGGAGSDVLRGGSGDDSLLGGGGTDTLSGGAGNDALNGEAGEDTLFGGAGDDELEGRNATDRLFGGTGDDILDGGKGNDTIEGGPGNDTLVGGADADTLVGGAGDDVIEGGNGADTLAGSAGRDLFLFASVDDSPEGAADRIVDFQLGRDGIDLSMIDADPGISGDQPFIFIGQDEFTGAAGELRLHLLPDSDQSRIEADIDASGIGDLVITLDGLIVLDAGSFIL
ncbi:MAG: M10 family metallopeptidase C-terminal domain-containing protein, partial [Pseudomonadota bacterium]